MTTYTHMTFRINAAIACGMMNKASRRSRVAACIGGNKAEIDAVMAYLLTL